MVWVIAGILIITGVNSGWFEKKSTLKKPKTEITKTISEDTISLKLPDYFRNYKKLNIELKIELEKE